MRWILALALFPTLALASEECVGQYHGTCRAACLSGEKAEQGAFIDCGEKELCCVPAPPRERSSAAVPGIRKDEDARTVAAVAGHADTGSDPR